MYNPGTSNAPEPTRHQDTFNILWVDGHVSNMSTLTFKAGKPSFESLANGSRYYIYAGKK
ncbi:MAG: hypothetical protein IJC34_03800 [Lentisphaeria bacterium]|nr:hypothetical protein [Lentisphaeria bacterium]